MNQLTFSQASSSKKKNVVVWYFQHGKNIPLYKTPIHEVTSREFLSYFNERLIDCQFVNGYFSIKVYSHIF